MARTLETLDLGTPVFCGETRVGDVRGLYAEGSSARSVEWVVVDWAGRGAVAVPAIEIGSVDERGVTLIQAEPREYEGLPAFNEQRFPTVRKLA